MLHKKTKLARQHMLVAIALITLVVGAIRATVVAFSHVAPLPLETLFFVVAGIAQIALAILVFKKTRLKYVGSLFVFNGGLALLWVLTRIYRAPFMETPEAVDRLGLTLVVLEVITLVGVGVWKWLERHRIKEVHGYSFTAVLAILIFGSVLMGGGTMATGRVGEMIMPNRTVTHDHGHGNHHSHHTSHRSNDGANEAHVGCSEDYCQVKEENNKDIKQEHGHDAKDDHRGTVHHHE